MKNGLTVTYRIFAVTDTTWYSREVQPNMVYPTQEQGRAATDALNGVLRMFPDLQQEIRSFVCKPVFKAVRE